MGGQRHPRLYPEDPFPRLMMLPRTGDGDDSADTPKLDHQNATSPSHDDVVGVTFVLVRLLAM
ncbi:hypothetical protein ACTXT7_017347, partial [Hymenolepis weldensis]